MAMTVVQFRDCGGLEVGCGDAGRRRIELISSDPLFQARVKKSKRIFSESSD
jgi:hypothetical protein